MTHTLFFATREDILPVFEIVENRCSLAYALTGQFSDRQLRCFVHGAAIPNVGTASADSAINCETYLITKDCARVDFRAITRLDGSAMFSIDQLANPDSVTFTAGGKWGNDVLLHGRVATASDSDTAKELMKVFNLAIRKQFKKVGPYWVGPAAYVLLEAGWRLTSSARSPRDFDLIIAR